MIHNKIQYSMVVRLYEQLAFNRLYEPLACNKTNLYMTARQWFWIFHHLHLFIIFSLENVDATRRFYVNGVYVKYAMEFSGPNTTKSRKVRFSDSVAHALIETEHNWNLSRHGAFTIHKPPPWFITRICFQQPCLYVRRLRV